MLASAPFRVVAFILLIAGLIILSGGVLGQLLKFGTMVVVSLTNPPSTHPAFPAAPLLKELEALATPVFDSLQAATPGGERPDVFAAEALLTKDPAAWTSFLTSTRERFGRGGSRFLDKEASYVQADGTTARLAYRMVFEKNKKGRVVCDFARGEAGWRLTQVEPGTHVTVMDRLEPFVDGATAVGVLALVVLVIARWLKTPTHERSAFLKALALYEALTVGVVVVLFPFFWMFCTSFKASGTELIFNEKNPFDIVANEPTIDNFRKVLKLDQAVGPGARVDDVIEQKNNFSTYFINSLFVATTAAFLVTLFSAMAAYVFSKKDLPYKNGLFSVLLGTMMIPGLMYMVPQFFMICQMGLCGTKLAMFLPHLASVFGVFMLKQYMDTIPSSLLEAARIDGASEWQCFTVVIIPLAMPIILTLFLLTFLFHWSNFLWQLIVTDFANPLSITLPVGLALFRGQYTSETGQIMAASCFSIVPIAVLFLIAQKYFIEGMTQGAVKE
ncbi:MAG: Carbohydrate ABC transport system, permease protein 2 [Candidatus Ozemobacter sibiricus]|jgi:multiple sugar transport system permease protein|uniref:Carbohydrate ABC transport system, permease protein 2 n=1 Tax=Candidatus Ozemobacter sibiricus TaxID=2268124 RepID=A0A367ZL94_9BACT|nr:MAG: Carbohydrate ABC transport system, permease protein 2 [Candidatus Ozemobacter sibiricus]